ncbi:UNVERIFIED_CONTAM: hypothetical protein HDU68_007132 [Siphonaria sp. JEL0065]|nr:hypothetical protein HDU68_007132 [Siphonaria sp. JEL0065]
MLFQRIAATCLIAISLVSAQEVDANTQEAVPIDGQVTDPLMDNLVLESVPNVPIVASKKWFDRIIITYLENTDYDQAIEHFEKLNEAPHFGTLLTNYHGVFHPSQPNYVALVTGDTIIKSDVVVDIDSSSIVDLLEAKNITWGAYSEDYPDDFKSVDGKPFTDNHIGRYVRRHSEFCLIKFCATLTVTFQDALASLTSVQNNPKRAQNIKSAEAFKRELEAETLPEFILYTPNQDNNAHDTNTAYAARYIKDFYIPMMSHPFFLAHRTLFVLTFDESASYVFGENHVATWLLGTAVDSTPLNETIGVGYEKTDWEWASESFKSDVPPSNTDDKPTKDKPNFYLSNIINLSKVIQVPGEAETPEGDSDNTFYTHYDTLKTVELNWGLGDLGRKDANATGFGKLLRPYF